MVRQIVRRQNPQRSVNRTRFRFFKHAPISRVRPHHVGFLQFCPGRLQYLFRMTQTLRSLNWFAILGASLAYFMLGAVWYAPFAFGPLWRTAIGLSHVPEINTPQVFIVPLASAFTATLATATLVKALRLERVTQGAQLGAFVALCYSIAAVATDAVAPHQPHPLAYVLIVGGYHLTGLVSVAAFVTRFRGSPTATGAAFR